jgi:TRAP-type C4-dicarboxylate transport system substrate-binding protein
MQQYFERIKAVTGGRIEVVEESYSGALVKQADVVEALNQGFVDMSRSVGQYYPEIRPYHSVMNLPFLVDSTLQACLAQRHLENTDSRFAAEDEQALGAKTIFVFGATDLYMLVKEPIQHLDEWKGLNLRAPTRAAMGIIEGLGGTPTSIPTAELYEALQRGSVDGVSSTVLGCIGMGWHEQAPWMVDWNLGVLWDISPMMSLQKFNTLSPADQQLLLDIGDKHMLDFAVGMAAKLATVPEQLQAQGGGILPIADEEKAQWEATLRPVVFDAWKESARSYGISDPQAVLDLWEATLAQFKGI